MWVRQGVLGREGWHTGVLRRWLFLQGAGWVGDLTWEWGSSGVPRVPARSCRAWLSWLRFCILSIELSFWSEETGSHGFATSACTPHLSHHVIVEEEKGGD